MREASRTKHPRRDHVVDEIGDPDQSGSRQERKAAAQKLLAKRLGAALRCAGRPRRINDSSLVDLRHGGAIRTRTG